MFTSAVAHAGEALKPPIELPLNTQKVGEKYSFDVSLVEPLTSSIELIFLTHKPSKWGHFFDKEETVQDAKRIGKILGGPKKVNNEWIETGVPAKFRVRFIKKDDSSIVLDQTIDHPKTAAQSGGRYAILATKTLPAGLYTIELEYLSGAPELATLYANIRFARAYLGK